LDAHDDHTSALVVSSPSEHVTPSLPSAELAICTNFEEDEEMLRVKKEKKE
jgi:hypothetical protein